MDDSRLETVTKWVFVASLVVLAFLYGAFSWRFQLFPSSYLDQAWDQAQAIVPQFTGAVDAHFETRQVYEETGVDVVRQEAMSPGLTLIVTRWPELGGDAGLRLLDVRGRVVHEWRVTPEEIFSDAAQIQIHGTHLYPDGDVVINLNVGTTRLDACGRVEWKLRHGGHHSVDQADDGTFWISGYERDISSDRYPGLEGTLDLVNTLTHVSADGEVLEEISVLDLLYENGLERLITKYGVAGRREDITHLNDVEALDASLADEYPEFDRGDLAVSLRNLHLVFVFDPDSRRVLWHNHESLIRQHDPDFIGNGWIGIFDNNSDGTERGTMLGGSRILAVKPSTGEERILFPTPASEPFYTPEMGKWQMLPNGNLLLTESQAGRVVEVSPDGRTVWEWIAEPYKRGTVAEVTEGTRYSLSEEEVDRWPCSRADSAGGERSTGA